MVRKRQGTRVIVTKMVQETSIECYYDILESGLLGEMQDTVYMVFVHNMLNEDTPIDRTNMEIADKMGLDVCNVTPRTYELRKKGLVEFSKKRVCEFSGRRVMAWKLTGIQTKIPNY